MFICKVNERNEDYFKVHEGLRFKASTYLLSKLIFSNKILHEKFKAENPSREVITLPKKSWF